MCVKYCADCGTSVPEQKQSGFENEYCGPCQVAYQRIYSRGKPIAEAAPNQGR